MPDPMGPVPLGGRQPLRPARERLIEALTAEAPAGPRLRPDMGPGAFEDEGGQVQAPSRGRGFLGQALTGLVSGFRGAEAGAEFKNRYFNGPFAQAVAAAQEKEKKRVNKIGALGKLAEFEQEDYKEQREALTPKATGGGIWIPDGRGGGRWELPPAPLRPDQSVTELDIWSRQNPNAPIKEFFDMKNSTQKSSEPASVQEYEYAKKNGYKGSILQYYNEKDAPAKAAGNNSSASEAATVMRHPELWGQLTANEKLNLAPELEKLGFDSFGKPLSDRAIVEITMTKNALGSLGDLRKVLVENEQFIGPLSGIQSLNPYSDARKAQARIDLVKQRVGKALEGGVLRKEDEEKYKRILATLFDTPSTAISKVDGLISTLERDLNNFTEMQSGSGRNVPKPAGPAVGTIKGGYRFKGGNPADQKNWEKVK